MRFTLFDWTSGGHHSLYLRQFAEALLPDAEVVAAAPDAMLDETSDLSVEQYSLGDPRPVIDKSRSLMAQHRELAEHELDLLQQAAERTRPDHLIHLYGDPILRRLVRRPRYPVPLTLCIFFPRAHYPTSYATPLSPRERLRAYFHEHLVAHWRRRPDAHALFALDEEAVRRWSGRRGATPFSLPEPPIGATAEPSDLRQGCLLYGTLAPRKGIDLLARAVGLSPTPLKVTLAGEVEPGFRGLLEAYATSMKDAGASVELRLRRHVEEEALGLMAGSRCVLLPYLNHYTGSRVLLEAATVGTPVIAHEDGLLGDLVRRRGLGLTVDCRDPVAFCTALLQLATGVDTTAQYRGATALYAAGHAAERFRQAVWGPFGQPASVKLEDDLVHASSVVARLTEGEPRR